MERYSRDRFHLRFTSGKNKEQVIYMNNNPALIIDGLLLLIIVIGAIQGYRDGFFTSVIRLIGTAGSFFAALFVSDNYSQQI
ncbi:MAG: CvpA family protein, partial [Oscillospiraceae bacterium]|nr:CvpA family protein [Oscillospiraceae bacterium]